MKRLVLAALLAAGFAAGCSSTQSPDPDNGVSSTSYRKALAQVEADTAQISSKLDEVQGDAVANAATGGLVARPASWWGVELRLSEQTRKLAHDTLAGSTR